MAVMMFQEEYDIGCPYCGETMTVLIDPGLEQQQYVEDCQICCQPMIVEVTNTDGRTEVTARQEND